MGIYKTGKQRSAVKVYDSGFRSCPKLRSFIVSRIYYIFISDCRSLTDRIISVMTTPFMKTVSAYIDILLFILAPPKFFEYIDCHHTTHITNAASIFAIQQGYYPKQAEKYIMPSLQAGRKGNIPLFFFKILNKLLLRSLIIGSADCNLCSV